MNSSAYTRLLAATAVCAALTGPAMAETQQDRDREDQAVFAAKLKMRAQFAPTEKCYVVLTNILNPKAYLDAKAMSEDPDAINAVLEHVNCVIESSRRENLKKR